MYIDEEKQAIIDYFELLQEQGKKITRCKNFYARDNGQAYAFEYRGNDEGILSSLEDLKSHAMVKPAGSMAAECREIDAFCPKDPTLAAKMASQGFRAVGLIENHYRDVLSFVNPLPPTHYHLHEGRFLSFYDYLPEPKLNSLKELWVQNKDQTLDESKALRYERVARAEAWLLQEIMTTANQLLVIRSPQTGVGNRSILN